VSRVAVSGKPTKRFIRVAPHASLTASLLLDAVLLISATAPTLARPTGNTGTFGKSGTSGVGQAHFYDEKEKVAV
jgi:hypothetical protein